MKARLSRWINKVSGRYTQPIFEFIDRRLPVSVPGAEEQISKAVLTWEGVAAHSHRFGSG